MKYCRISTALIMGFFILVLLTTSCSRKVTSSTKKTISVAESSLSVARLIDIPIPLGFTLVHQENSAQMSMLQFQGTKNIEASIQFYLQEMDQLGWKLTNFSTQTSGVLLCEKGYRSCVINVTQQAKTTVTLHIKKQHSIKQKRYLDINKKQLETRSAT